MLTHLKSLFSSVKQNRLAVLVYHDGKVEIYQKNDPINNSVVASYLNDDMTIAGVDKHKDIQVLEIDIYEDNMVYPKQTLYSIPYSPTKVPAGRSVLPKQLYNTVWNFLEGAHSETLEKPATFKVHS